jgi:hypothetical protein
MTTKKVSYIQAVHIVQRDYFVDPFCFAKPSDRERFESEYEVTEQVLDCVHYERR